MPASAWPLNEQENHRLQEAVSGLTPAQLQWVSGYAAGLAASDRTPAATVPAPEAQPAGQLLVLFGSQTGNGERVATGLAEQARAAGFGASAISMADFKPAALKRESLVTFVVSTHGEGDPPDDAELFHEYLMSERARPLPQLQYSVLALGDSSYVNFCQTGREFDQRLADLGASRFVPIVECDLDFDAAAAAWSDQVLEQLPELFDDGAQATPTVLRAVTNEPAFDKDRPFAADVLVNQKITGARSSKDVRHIELSLEGSGLSYAPGDALAVLASNPPALVDEFLEVLALAPDARVRVDGAECTLREALRDKLEITVATVPFLRQWAEQGEDPRLLELLDGDHPEQLAEFLATHQIIDVIREYPAATDAESLVARLRKLSPRSYSIASSPAANPDEVHLTVAAVRYEAFGRPHWGAASTMLADRIDEGGQVSVFVESNPRFRLPADDVPIVMIGAGTGIAPFRAFVEERAERDAGGKNWLFFGDRNFSEDFLYQLEWQRYLKQGKLTRLDVAFSRDQAEKVYVQDRLRARGAELFEWLEQGAVVYVCGDAKHMAGDVDTALVDILATHGNVDRDTAATRLKAMRREKRYQRDVY